MTPPLPPTAKAPSARARLSPWRSMFIVGASIFFVEVGIMLLFLVLPELPPLWGTIFDAVALVTVVAPVLYFFSLRPILQAMNQLQDAEETIRRFSHEMEQTVVDRTRDLALAAEVGRALGSVRNLEMLLTQAVELIGARFGLEYTQVFLTDLKTHALVLRAGTGEVGAELLRRQLRLPIGAGSLNGLAVAERQPLVVEDTRTSAQFRPNPLLPDVRSEIVVPLIVSDQVVGTLDLQSTRPGALTQANLPAFEALAGQLAIAIQNAELFGMVEQARSAVEAQTRHSARAGWEHFLNAVERSEHFGFAYAEGELAPLTAPVPSAAPGQPVLTAPLAVSGEPVGALQLEGDPDVPWTADESELVQAVARRVAQQLENLRLLAEAEDYQRRAEEAVRRLTREGWGAYEEQVAHPGFVYDANQIAPLSPQPAALPAEFHGMELMQPLTIRNETIGELVVGGLPAVTDEAAELVNAVAEKLSTHLESLRLFEQTQNALARAQALYETGRDLMVSENIGQLLCGVADKIARVLPAHRVLVINFDVEERAVRYFAQSQTGLEDVANTSFDGLWNGLSGWALREARSALSFKDTPDPREDEAAQQRRRDDNCGAIIVVPLQLRGKALGTITAINRPDQRDFSVNDVELMEAMATQVAVALDNRSLFEQTQAALVSTEALYQATSEFAGARSYDDILRVLTERTLMGHGSTAVGIGFFDQAWTPQRLPTRYDVAALQLRLPSEQAARVPSQFAFSAMPYQRVLRADAVTAAEDLSTDPRFTAADRDLLQQMFNARAVIFAPIVVRGQLIGAINALYPQPTEFPESDIRQLTTLASQAAVAMENLRSLEQTQRALSETEVLYNASRRLTAATDLQGIVSAVVESMPNPAINRALLLAFTHDALGELEQGVVIAQWHAGWGVPPAPVGTVYPREVFHTLLLLVSSQPTFFEDLLNDPRADEATRTLAAEQNIRAVAVLPLWVGAQQFGIFMLQGEAPHQFSEAEIRPYLALTQQMAVVVENRQLFEQTQAALAEAAQLYNASRRLASAEDLTLMVTAMAEGVPIPEINRAVLMSLERDVSGAPIAAQVMAHWHSGRGPLPTPVGRRYPLHTFKIFELAVADEPIFLANSQTDPRLDEATHAEVVQQEIFAIAVLPLWVGGEQIGFLLLEATAPHEFVDKEIRPYRSLAQQLAVAVENRRLFDQTQLALAEQIRVTAQLETVNQVTTATSTLLEPQALLQTVVDLTKARFNLYHTHIYLLNDPGDTLVLTVGAGEVGRQMVAEGRRIPLNHPHSLVARAARARQAAVANDVQAEPDFLPHPLLPDTRAELATPMMAGDQVVGVFDVQANRADFFTEETMRVQLTLATQVAVALQNAASFAEIATAREQLEAQARRLVRGGWHDYLDAVDHAERLGYAYDLASVTPMVEPLDLAVQPNTVAAPLVITGETLGALRVENEADRAWNRDEIEVVHAVARRLAQHVENLRLLDQAQRYREEAEQAIRRLTQTGWSNYALAAPELGFAYDQLHVTPAGETPPNNGHAPPALAQPLRVRGETIGQVAVEAEAALSAEDAELVTLVSERLSAHLENLRLFEQTQAALAESEELYTISARLGAANTLTELLQAVAHRALGPAFVGAFLFAMETDAHGQPHALTVTAAVDPAGQPTEMLLGTRFQMGDLPTTRYWLADPSRPFIIRDTVADARLTEADRAVMTGTGASISIPLLIGQQWVGLISLAWAAPQNFTAQDERMYQAIGAQAAIAINSRTLFEATRRRAERERMVNTITQKIQSATSVSGALQTAIEELGLAFRARHTQVELGTAPAE